jgi:restriction endonuclease Mrr
MASEASYREGSSQTPALKAFEKSHGKPGIPISYVPFDGGEPVWEPDVEALVEDALARNEVEGFFSRIAVQSEDADEEEDEEEKLVSADALLAKGAGLVVEIDIEEVNAELVQYLAKHPEKMREMAPRKFEELVAELLKDKGYEVELTPRSKDGGFDIRVVHKTELGRFLIFVECKRYAEGKPVGVHIIRSLYGVVNMHNATSGLIATTSYFTRGAKSEQKTIQARLQLKDFDDLKAWLAAYCSRR